MYSAHEKTVYCILYIVYRNFAPPCDYVLHPVKLRQTPREITLRLSAPFSCFFPKIFFKNFVMSEIIRNFACD